jgi:hypothetical protein
VPEEKEAAWQALEDVMNRAELRRHTSNTKTSQLLGFLLARTGVDPLPGDLNLVRESGRNHSRPTVSERMLGAWKPAASPRVWAGTMFVRRVQSLARGFQAGRGVLVATSLTSTSPTGLSPPPRHSSPHS